MPRRFLEAAFFSDEKIKKASVPERLLAAAIIANADDDGRLKGDVAYLRSVCFLYDKYSLGDLKRMRDHLTEVNPNFLLYKNGAGDEYLQLLKFRRYQSPRYYHPSKYPPPPGWPFGEDSGDQKETTEQPLSNQKATKEQPHGNQVVTSESPDGHQKETTEQPPSYHLVTQGIDLDKGKGLDKGKIVDEVRDGATTSPTTNSLLLFNKLKDSYLIRWGTVSASDLTKVTPRPIGSKTLSQLRDIARELSAAGGCRLDTIEQAFDEAAGQGEAKMKVSYVRAILMDWLGIPRAHSP